MNDEINNLPDYAALQRLAVALWQQESAFNGAAVMVGAGFSRIAATTGDPRRKLPLWSDLADVIARQLRTSPNGDPLRLAEEYSAYFGKQAIFDLAHREIHDPGWKPGDLHKSLLDLPWSDVLTTNWDTLLERAALMVHKRVYNVVLRQEDLASTRSPRIVKLHGTIGGTDTLIFTQEDFRRYPSVSAAFVNFARQVFIENELCLLGFSGDDPNFLEWAGWVRDNLAMHSRRIYLVGALGLSAAKRKYLESINVAPIDLAELVNHLDEPDAKHRMAAQLFLAHLQALKPHNSWNWLPSNMHSSITTPEEWEKRHRDAKYGAELISNQLEILAANRMSYPGWLVCPQSKREQLQLARTHPYPSAAILASLSEANRAKLLYELAWQHSITFEPLSHWLCREMLAVCNLDAKSTLSKRQQMEIALTVLKNSQWLPESEADNVDTAASQALQDGLQHWPQIESELAYHQAIIARDSFDFPKIQNLIEKIDHTDSIWKLRKAALLGDVGEFAAGRALVAEAYKQLLNQYRNERNSIYIISRLEWASWLLRGVEMLDGEKTREELPSSHQDMGCSAWDHVRELMEGASETLRKQREQDTVEPEFIPGSYRDGRSTMSFSSAIHPLVRLSGVAREAGLPLKWGNVNYLIATAEQISQLEGIRPEHRFSLAIRTASSGDDRIIKRVFSRVEMARLPREIAAKLANTCIKAIDYWSNRAASGPKDSRIHAIERLRVFIEVLARASVRVEPDLAKIIFSLGCSLGARQEFAHPWLFESLDHLLQYSLEAVPLSEQRDLVRDALAFPLPQNDRSTGWPNPILKAPGVRKPDSSIDRRIQELIEAIELDPNARTAALLRILALVRSEFLTKLECETLGSSLWKSISSTTKLPETGDLAASVLLELPSPDKCKTRTTVINHLFDVTATDLFEGNRLLGMANAANHALPSREQALACFDILVRWRPSATEDILMLAKSRERRIAGLIGSVIFRSTVGAFYIEDYTNERFQALVAFCGEVLCPEALPALPNFAGVVERSDFIESLIKRHLFSADQNQVAHAAHAVLIWREICDIEATRRLIDALTYRLAFARVNGLPSLLHVARQLLTKNLLQNDNIKEISAALPLIFSTYEYDNLKTSGLEAASASIVRAECTKLATEVIKINPPNHSEIESLLKAAQADALPEVRFAQSSAG